ncbi:SCO1860 family LAETG-anchored protein [Streptomyces sp. enrichment culture]|uniref:SCO1860 family LAETG-anchored protein n=1 Tax=Streptomyces sp. enrichment culture TaxID=1795815 RepID=UPI003F550D67
MYTINVRTHARRWATVAAATALAAGSAVLTGAGPAHATGGSGGASAAVLRTGLDVALLDKTVHAPLAVSVNEVRAPGSARRTALTARLDGVDGGKPFSVLRAEAADAKATVDGGRAEASSTLAGARLHVPGLPLLSVVELEAVSSRAVCEAGRSPHASVTLPAAVTVLGRRVELTAGGPTRVAVPGVGEVRLDLSKTETTSTTAAATALRLEVSVNPLKLNVAGVEGTLTLAETACETPEAPAAPAADGVRPQGARAERATPAAEAGLAETGGDAVTPYAAAGAAALLAAGATAVAVSRRGRRG